MQARTAVLTKGSWFLPLPRYRVISLEMVTDAAENGCGICWVLEQGISHFWSDMYGDEHEDEHEDEDEGEGKDPYHDNTVAGGELTRNHSGGSTDGPASQDGEHQAQPLEKSAGRDGKRRLHVWRELRPRRNLQVTRVGPRPHHNMQRVVRPRLDLFDEPSTFPARATGCQGVCLRPGFLDSFGRASILPGVTDLEDSSRVRQRWLDGCKDYPVCSERSGYLPTRLFDVSNSTPRFDGDCQPGWLGGSALHHIEPLLGQTRLGRTSAARDERDVQIKNRGHRVIRHPCFVPGIASLWPACSVVTLSGLIHFVLSRTTWTTGSHNLPRWPISTPMAILTLQLQLLQILRKAYLVSGTSLYGNKRNVNVLGLLIGTGDPLLARRVS